MTELSNYYVSPDSVQDTWSELASIFGPVAAVFIMVALAIGMLIYAQKSGTKR